MRIYSYIPSHRIGEFQVHMEQVYNIDFDDANLPGNIKEIVSSFLYPSESKTEDSHAPSAPKRRIIPKESESFQKVLDAKVPEEDREGVTELVWQPVVIKKTGRHMFAVEIFIGDSMIKRIVVEDKDKSFRFVSFLTKKLIYGGKI